MKGKIPKIVFLVVALALALSLVAVVAPAKPTTAGNLTWTTVGTPTLGASILLPESSIDQLALAADGTTMYAGLDIGALLALVAGVPQWGVAKSTNGGLSWSACGALPGVAGPLTGLAVAPDDVLYVVATGPGVAGVSTVWSSADGGGTWSVTGTIATIDATLPATAVITSVDVGPLVTPTVRPIAVGIFDTAATDGGCYVWGLGVPPAVVWNPLPPPPAAALVEDITSVAFSPNYTTDLAIVFVGHIPVAGAQLHLYDGVAVVLDPAGLYPVPVDLAAVPAARATEFIMTGPPLGTTCIALPLGFNGGLASMQVAFVGTNIPGAPPATGDVWRVRPLPAGSAALAWGGGDVASVDFVGTIGGSAALIAGAVAPSAAVPYATVMSTTNPWAAPPWWSGANKPPTGLSGMAQVAFKPDFLTSGVAFCATGGAAGAIDESALSRTTDSGLTWNQISLINTYMDGGILDVMPSPDYANDMTIFMVTACTFAGAGDIDGPGPLPAFAAGSNYESLWKTTMGGTLWERVDVMIAAANTALVRLSPDYATDSTVYWADAGALPIRVSSDGGAFFSARTAFGAIADMVAEDATTVYVASGSQVGKSTNSGSTWPVIGTTLGGVFTIIQDADSGHLAVAGSGAIYLITDTTTMTSTAVGTLAGAGLGSVQLLALSNNYATDSTIYIADATNLGGIWKLVLGASVVPMGVTAANLPAAGNAVGLVMSDDGVLYAADAAPLVGIGVRRSVNPEATPVTLGTVPEWLTMNQGLGALPAAAVFGLLRLATGTSNVLLAVETANPAMAIGLATPCADRLMAYTDTLPMTPNLVSPENAEPGVGTIVGVPVGTPMYYITVEWEAVTGAVGYGLQIDTDPGFANPWVNIGAQIAGWPVPTNPLWVRTAAPINAPATSYTTPAGPAAMLNPDTEYFWRVRVDNTALTLTAAVGRWSETWSFTTGPGVAPPAPTLTSPAAGATNVPLRPTFTWTPVVGATSYDLEVATDAAFADLVFPTVTLGDQQTYQAAEDLDPGANYFWRVKGYSATTESAWASAGFTTAVPAVTPIWIWILIAIGAIVAVAVIVLIVRTRRPV